MHSSKARLIPTPWDSSPAIAVRRSANWTARTDSKVALCPEVPVFRQRSTEQLITVGSMLIGSLALLVGARWAVASMGALGSLAMIAIFVAMPHARHIR